jgi:hypothetical protein
MVTLFAKSTAPGANFNVDLPFTVTRRVTDRP